MGQDPDAIRAEIEQTRARMGDTVDAPGYKADVKGRAKDKVSDTKDRITGAVGGITGRVSDATPDSGEVKGQARKAAGLGLKVVAYDPYLTPARATALQVELVQESAQVYPQVDFLTVHMPMTEETKGLINGAAFARMMRIFSARPINSSRKSASRSSWCSTFSACSA